MRLRHRGHRPREYVEPANRALAIEVWALGGDDRTVVYADRRRVLRQTQRWTGRHALHLVEGVVIGVHRLLLLCRERPRLRRARQRKGAVVDQQCELHLVLPPVCSRQRDDPTRRADVTESLGDVDQDRRACPREDARDVDRPRRRRLATPPSARRSTEPSARPTSAPGRATTRRPGRRSRRR